MTKLAVFSLVLLALVQFSSAHREFFPAWRNCQDDPTIEIIDMYLDHQPKPTLSNNTFTMCAGRGKEIAIDNLHLIISRDDEKIIYNHTFPEVHGMTFVEGDWHRCLSTVIPEFADNGNYTMRAELYINQQGLVGCVDANWHLSRPTSFRLDAF